MVQAWQSTWCLDAVIVGVSHCTLSLYTVTVHCTLSLYTVTFTITVYCHCTLSLSLSLNTVTIAEHCHCTLSLYTVTVHCTLYVTVTVHCHCTLSLYTVTIAEHCHWKLSQYITEKYRCTRYVRVELTYPLQLWLSSRAKLFPNQSPSDSVWPYCNPLIVFGLIAILW